MAMGVLACGILAAGLAGVADFLAALVSRHRGSVRTLLHARGEIERRFGILASFACGLNPLSAWGRRLHRVRTWVGDKLLVNTARILIKQGLTATLQ